VTQRPDSPQRNVGRYGEPASKLWLVFGDESGQGVRPPKSRTWGRRGHTPVVKVTSANLAKRNLAQLTALIKTRLKRIQYRPCLLDGFLASTGLDLTPFCNPAIKQARTRLPWQAA
jgi:hypothetical protein